MPGKQGTDDGQRPDPDRLLERLRDEEPPPQGRRRGRLKVFFGFAAGVGKTFSMLQDAQALRARGTDVVVGWVEPHGRVETEALLAGIERLPPRDVPYRGVTLRELDLDAALARRPGLLLVDELAHSNAPGSRHAKRWQDVEELRDAGIDVHTTLNVQHVESLNDVVAQITRVRVRETVPDSIIDRADDVEVVDITPEDLIQRLKDGKVYVPQQAERAIRHYFMPGNLTALRELALRRTAQRVDEQMVDYMRLHAIRGPWAAGERVLVGISEYPSDGLIRYARRLADRLRAPWAAIYVETARTHHLTESERDRLATMMRLAERLGGDAVTVPGADVATGMIDYAREHNYTHIVIAKARRSRWFQLLHGSIAHQLIRNGGDIGIHVIPEDRSKSGEIGSRRAAAATKPLVWSDGAAFGLGLAMVAAATVLGLAVQQWLHVSNITLIYLAAVLVTAIRTGLWPSLLACLLATLCYNFFFLPPLYTFTIADPNNVVALIAFALVSIITTNLTARVRAQALAASQRARSTDELYSFSRKLAGAVLIDDLLWATAYQIAAMLKVRVVLLMPEGDSIAVRAGYPPEDQLEDADLAAAKWAWQSAQPAGRGSDTLPGARWLFLPMRTGRGMLGVVGLDNDEAGPILTPDRRRLLDSLIDQAALAIERTALAQDVDRARLAAEAERLQSALLTSISHDLRTPLSSILGSASSLKSYGASLDEASKSELLDTIQEEAERLNRFISNLLDMTRLESGVLQPRFENVDVADVVGSSLDRARKVLGEHLVEIDLAADLPLVRADPVLLEQVLFNLLDNAAKYAPQHTTVRVEARASDRHVLVEIKDEGQGIPADDVDRIFDKFYRIRSADRKRAGTGLGLAICRGLVEAMGGTITAGNRSDRQGAVFVLSLPIGEASVALPEAAA